MVLLKTYDKFLLELLDFSYTEINRLLDKVIEITHADTSDYIRPGVALVLLLNSVKIELLSISGAWISSRNERKKVLEKNLTRARNDFNNDDNR